MFAKSVLTRVPVEDKGSDSRFPEMQLNVAHFGFLKSSNLDEETTV